MSRALALSVHTLHRVPVTEWLRMAIVSGCALALILADKALPV